MTPQQSLVDTINILAQLVVFKSYSFDEFLKKLLTLLNRIIPVNSCFIYFFDRERKELILCASKKSHKNLMGKITMKKGEGITGWVAAHQKTVVLKKAAYKDARFKPFEELPEDRYEAFLSVPVVDREGVVGVVNLQHKDPYAFSTEEVKMVEAIVQIIASAFEKVVLERRVDTLQEKLEERKLIERAKGLLMKKEKLTEKKAFDMIRHEAMKKRKSMREIAEAVVLLYE